MKIYLEVMLLIIAVAALGYLFFYSADILFSPVTSQSPENQVCFNQRCFFVKLAKTTAEREKGLMFVKQMDKNSGMFFIFDNESIYPFWMKDTLIPLDMIWLDSNYKVVFIGENAQPCKILICPMIIPTAKAKYVLEINGGVSKEVNIKIGDTAELKINQ